MECILVGLKMRIGLPDARSPLCHAINPRRFGHTGLAAWLSAIEDPDSPSYRESQSSFLPRGRGSSPSGSPVRSTSRRSLGFLPDGSYLVAERPGRLLLVAATGEARTIGGIPEVTTVGHGGLIDLAVDPDYAENGTIYFSYLVGREESSIDPGDEGQARRSGRDPFRATGAVREHSGIEAGSDRWTPRLDAGRLSLSYHRRQLGG